MDNSRKTLGLIEVHVQVGDLVREGDILAQLEEPKPLDSYQAAVTSAELSVLIAQQSLDDLYTNADLRQAEALQAISVAQQALDALAVDIPSSRAKHCKRSQRHKKLLSKLNTSLTV